MRVRPAPGRLVRDPHTNRELALDGARVPATSFWIRRLLSGDVEPLDEEARAFVPGMDRQAVPPFNRGDER